ncbi:Peptidase family M1 protein [Synechococcus sp. PCC 7335]|uniref:M1 family metallopeptidase n=1 Tax=Synechococcus sp. (strain ATCC 29403 / PCC 7335) TaxID=91464 RepID=UPI00017EB811|nr:M1 family metallopeptidase [Synechococcus sp. PCC 7335]EDX84000.1 Peptidase family M1 protein [Synechococcus sp. PCC 7335]
MLHDFTMENIYERLLDQAGRKTFELPGAYPHYNPDRPGQVEHIALDLVFDVPKKSYSGSCSVTIKPVVDGVSSLTMDAVDLNIKSVKVGKIKQSFDYDGQQLKVVLKTPTTADKSFTLTIDYAVENPQRGLYFVGPDQHYPDKPTQIWTQGEDEDSRFWFPCFDYPGQLATSEIRAQVPQKFKVVSNGELVSTKSKGTNTIYHWKLDKPHPSYLMTLAIGEFDEIEDEWQGRPVRYFFEQGREVEAKLTMGKTPQMLDALSSWFGYTYPFSKYDQVCVSDFIFGGMENTTTTLLTDRCLIDQRAAIDNLRAETLVAHELAHQWFGDLIVINHWSQAWVKEGAATYSEVLWIEKTQGQDEAFYYHLNHARAYLSEDKSRYRRPLVTHIYREAIELYDRHIYEKGSCVYHMIRMELGDELFTRAMRTLLEDNAHSTVETVDLLRAIDKATGRNLRFLFDQYVYRGGHPDYKVGYSWDSDSNLAKLTVTQTQVEDGKSQVQEGLFDLKVPIGFGYLKAGAKDTKPELKIFKVRVHEREQALYFPLEAKPDFVSFDVGNHLLKTVELAYPIAELKAQLQADPDPISRLLAAEALAKKGSLEAVASLEQALKDEPFWAVRAEVAEQLGSVQLAQAEAALTKGLKDKHPKVRRAVVTALGKVKTTDSYKALKSVVEKGDESYYVEASAVRSLGKVGTATLDGKDKEKKTLKLLDMVLKERAGWNEVVRSGAIAGLSQFKSSEAALDLLLPYTELGVPQPLRLAAIRALGTISTGQEKIATEKILERLAALAREDFFLTQVATVGALAQMEVSGAVAILRTLADHSPDGRVKRRADEAAQKVQKKIDSDGAIADLRQELDEVKQTNKDLKSRLETLEAKSKN